MAKRFSDQELFELRNRIPIRLLIKNELNIPCKIIDQVFRFLCPLCNEFNTSTNPRTNLARCFRCEKNFNPIDIVIACKKMSFVQSVNFLKLYKSKLSNNKIAEHDRKHSFIPIGDIFKSLNIHRSDC